MPNKKPEYATGGMAKEISEYEYPTREDLYVLGLLTRPRRVKEFIDETKEKVRKIYARK